MSLASRLAAPPAAKTTQTVLDKWVNTLNPDDKAAVHKALTDTAWRHVDLQRALEEEGMPKIADTTFGVWRRRNGYTK